jgi:hypothetical protein
MAASFSCCFKQCINFRSTEKQTAENAQEPKGTYANCRLLTVKTKTDKECWNYCRPTSFQLQVSTQNVHVNGNTEMLCIRANLKLPHCLVAIYLVEKTSRYNVIT